MGRRAHMSVYRIVKQGAEVHNLSHVVLDSEAVIRDQAESCSHFLS